MPEYLLPSFALDLTGPYLSAMLTGDGREALRVVSAGLSAGLSVADLQLRMIVPAQREIGRLWQENQISVAQEHLATSISQLAISHLYVHLPRAAQNGKRVLVACVEGELHDLGARMGADFLETAGFDVHFLGANIATAKLQEVLAAERPDLLGLSATMHFHLAGLRSAVAAARSVLPALPIVVGGGLLEQCPGVAEELGVQGFGTRADELARLCRRLLAC